MGSKSAVIFCIIVCYLTDLIDGSAIIIVQDAKACFRRSLPGKRVTSNHVKRAVSCERVEDCQRECSEEKNFVCEGFNYRLDPAGRVQGDCELTAAPMQNLDPNRDLISDPDFDYYEKDRNMGGDCRKRRPTAPAGPSSGGYGPSSSGGGYGPSGGGYGGGGPYHGGGGGPNAGGYDAPRPAYGPAPGHGGFDGGPRPGGPRPGPPGPGGFEGGHGGPNPGGYGPRPGGHGGPYAPSSGGHDYGRPGAGGYPPPGGRPSHGGDAYGPPPQGPPAGRPHGGGYPPETGRPGYGPPAQGPGGPFRPADDRRGGPYGGADKFGPGPGGPGGHGGPYPPAEHRPRPGGPGGPYPPSGGHGPHPGHGGGPRPAPGGYDTPNCPYMPMCGGGGGGSGGGGRGPYPPSSGGGGGGPHYPPPSGGGGGYGNSGGGGGYGGGNRGGPYPPSGGGSFRPSGGGYRPYDDQPKDIGFPRPFHDYQHNYIEKYQPYNNRRIDWRPHHHHNLHQNLYNQHKYNSRLPIKYDYGYVPPRDHLRPPCGPRAHVGCPNSNFRPNGYLPPPKKYVPHNKFGSVNSWGQYGGHYGPGNEVNNEMYSYWGFNKHRRPMDERKGYYPSMHNGLNKYGRPYGPRPSWQDGPISSNAIGFEGPPHSHRPSYAPKDDCSMRSSAGFRLNKAIVKKFFAVPNIHECEKLCYTETEFKCISFAYRYSITLSAPSDNCYLSDRSYKQLDFYTDLEPDRDFDVYAMNKNGKHCNVAVLEEQSDCFIRIRSGQRFEDSVMKTALNCRTIVECQMECLNSKEFVCRAFSFRFGIRKHGDPAENCLLTDWPPTELDPRVHLVPAAGFEVYERGSFGHGCENDRPSVGTHGAVQKPTDKLCYVGFPAPSRLLPEAAKGALSVGSEVDCKVECTRARENTKFPCMSFSYRLIAQKGEPNCELSDIPSTDLQLEIDYTREATSYLYAWDNHNPQCNNRRQETWSMYTVNGLPCKRGTFCQENREAGFWSCEIEGGEVGSWDYCCRPDHKCGYSEGYSYPWCYVGPSKTQWRKCSEKYQPYNNQMFANKIDNRPPQYGPPSRPGTHRMPQAYNTWFKEKPFKPPYYHSKPGIEGPVHGKPDIHQYEQLFDHQFLDPPKPGGLAQLKTLPRHWPVSYLHKENPPHTTADLPESHRSSSKKVENIFAESTKNYTAINNLMSSIKAEETKIKQPTTTPKPVSAKIQKDQPSKEEEEELLLVRIPMTESPKESKKGVTLEIIDTKNGTRVKHFDKSLNFDDLFLITLPRRKSNNTSSQVTIEKAKVTTARTPKRDLQVFPIRRGYVQRTTRANLRQTRLKNPLET